jgi:hypothetical protein
MPGISDRLATPLPLQSGTTLSTMALARRLAFDNLMAAVAFKERDLQPLA